MVVKPLTAWSLLYKNLISDWCYHNKQLCLPDSGKQQGNHQKPEACAKEKPACQPGLSWNPSWATPPQMHLGGGRSNSPNPKFQIAFLHYISVLAPVPPDLPYWIAELFGCWVGFFSQEGYLQMPHTAWSDLHTSNQPTAKQGTGRWGQNSASYLLYFLLNFFPIQLTKLCNYTFIGQEVSLFPFLASFSVALPCFTGCSKLNITFKLHNKDLGGIEWMRKVTGREVSAKIRFAKQLHRT